VGGLYLPNFNSPPQEMTYAIAIVNKKSCEPHFHLKMSYCHLTAVFRSMPASGSCHVTEIDVIAFNPRHSPSSVCVHASTLQYST